MAGIFGIKYKRIGMDEELVECQPSEFYFSSLSAQLTIGPLDISIFQSASTFLDDQFSSYVFRNRLAQLFADAISGRHAKRSFRFDTHCTPAQFFLLTSLKQNQAVHCEMKGKSTSCALTRDSILTYHTGGTCIVLEFENIDLLFPLIGSFFYFWPMTTSRQYKTGGFKDFKFLGLDRFNTCITFTYDVHAFKLRVSGRLISLSYELAYESNDSHAARITELGAKLCGNIPFVDAETGLKYIVVSVERNGDKTLVNKSKPHLTFTGVVAWVLRFDNSKWRKDMVEKCKAEPDYRYAECEPMDPEDFDID
jgi:hypothetical protein